MTNKITQKLHEYRETKSKENDAQVKISELYDAALKLTQAGINKANQTTSVDDRIKTLAETLQALLDLVLETRNSVSKRQSELQTKIDTVNEILEDIGGNLPTEKKIEDED